MGIEAFAEAARLLLPDWHVSEVSDVEFLAPFKFYRNEPRSVRVEARLSPSADGLVADCRLMGSRVLHGRSEPQQTTHFTGRVSLRREATKAEPAEPPAAPGGPTADADAIYRVYFHGPAYRVLETAWRDNGLLVGRLPVELPANHAPADLAEAAAPRLVELCLQTAGVLEIGASGQMGLPRHIDRLRVLRPQRDADGRLFALVRGQPGAPGVYDATVVDESGSVMVELQGYRTETLGKVDDALRKPLAAVTVGDE
jgi:hypothetical protein